MSFSKKQFKQSRAMETDRKMKRMDFSFFAVITCLLLAGLVALFSSSYVYATSKGLPPLYFVIRQLIWILLGLCLFFGIARLNLEKLRPAIKPLTLLTLLLLGITLFMPAVAHVHRWIPLGFMNLQVSEFAKIIFILYLADFFDRNASKIDTDIKQFLKPLGIMILMLALIGLEPDLGTPALMFGTALLIFIAAGVKLKVVALPIALGILALIEEIIRVPYRMKRMKNFLSPDFDPLGTGYQIKQSILAVGSGGWFGKGFGASQLKLLYLPVPHTDFIFPIIAEEIGFLGCMVIMSLFLFMLFRGVRIARNAPSLFTALSAFGLTLSVTCQAYFNLYMATGLGPTKGLPLPFFSYGGSAILSALIASGIILNISTLGNSER